VVVKRGIGPYFSPVSLGLCSLEDPSFFREEIGSGQSINVSYLMNSEDMANEVH
jgi:hypothetical protein